MRWKAYAAAVLLLALPSLSYNFVEECIKLADREVRDQCYFEVAPRVALTLPAEAVKVCGRIEGALVRDGCQVKIIPAVVAANDTLALETCSGCLEPQRTQCFDSISGQFKGFSRLRFLYWSDPRIIVMGAMCVPLVAFLIGVVYLVLNVRRNAEQAALEAKRGQMYQEFIPSGGSSDEFQQFWYESGTYGGEEISFVGGEASPPQQQEGPGEQ
jgi:hypothetical protein